MAVAINGSGPITGLTSIESPTTINGLTIPTTGFGKILQVVRATDGTARSTTSTTYVDASISVTITPTSASSAIILKWTGRVNTQGTSNTNQLGVFQITDSSNNPISGAEASPVGGLNQTHSSGQIFDAVALTAYATPATTSAVTYKLRFKSDIATTTTNIGNNDNTGQLFAYEVSA